ncbi:MAG: FAD:protein FMN transferase [Acidobacteria bacterium]|nr:FAD:protein FMN transferase [Acidobacteriota bacterium]
MILPRPAARRCLFLLLALGLLAACPSTDSPPSATTCFIRRNLFLGTLYTVTIYHHQPTGKVYAAYEQLVRDLNRLEAMTSFQSPDSEIRRINNSAGGSRIALSRPFARLLDTADRYYRETDGCFDVTVHPLLAEWGFYRQKQSDPDPRQMSAILARIGFHRLHWQPGTAELLIPEGGVQLDFGGMIKGVAMDRAVTILRSAGLTNFHLDFGRSSHFAAGPADGRGWRIPIATPRNPEQVLLEARLDGYALAISAGGADWHSRSGQSYSLIVDPRNGQPATTPTMSVVISARATAADAWSTALLVDEGLLQKRTSLSPDLTAAAVITPGGVIRWYPDRVTVRPFFPDPSP